MERSTMLLTGKPSIPMGPSIPWQTVSHNQMVMNNVSISISHWITWRLTMEAILYYHLVTSKHVVFVTWYTLYHPYLLFLLPPWPGMGNRVVCGAPQPLGCQNGAGAGCVRRRKEFKQKTGSYMWYIWDYYWY